MQMGKRITEMGGVIKKRCEVIGATFDENKKVKSVKTAAGEEFFADHFISNAHPEVTIDLFGEDHFPVPYVKRIRSLKNSDGMFVLHIALKDKALKYRNHNIFQINNRDVWDLTCTPEEWPNFFMISFPPNSKDPEYAQSISVICGMTYKEFDEWKDTFHTDSEGESRGAAYEALKEKKAQLVLDAVEDHLPDIRKQMISYSSATPLTQRDYTYTPNGSGYGIERDADNPFRTMINSKTAISNLYLTGQNVTLHGVLGTSLTAILTCSNIVDKSELLTKIRGHQ